MPIAHFSGPQILRLGSHESAELVNVPLGRKE